MRTCLLLFLVFLLIGSGFDTCAQATEPRYRLGWSKPYQDKEGWTSKTFLAIEPESSHVTASITITQREASDKTLNGRKGSEHYLFVDATEFRYLEQVFRYSFTKSQGLKRSTDKHGFGYLLYFHLPPDYSETLVDKQDWLNTFFSSLVEEVQCPGNGVSEETKQYLVPLLRQQRRTVAK